jgi:hypothetical protein
VLARKAIPAQQLDRPASPERQDNLFEPAPGLWEAHGIFDGDARARSAQLWVTTHRRALAVAASVVAGALAVRARL